MTAAFGGDDVAPMPSVLLRTESAASSQIENLTVGARQLAIAELGGAASRNAELVARNVRAMDAATQLSDRLDTTSILAMHEALLGGHDARAGQWRDIQVARQHSAAGRAGRRLMNVLIGQPAINIAYDENKLGVSNTAARRAVEQAVSAGILTETTDRKRDRVFLARDVIDVLDEFAERAGRRAR